MLGRLLELLNEQDVKYIRNFKTSLISTIGIGETCAVVIYPKNVDELINVLNFIIDNKIEYKIIGRMSNVLGRDSFYEGAVILTTDIKSFEFRDGLVNAEAGIMFSSLLKRLAVQNLGGASELFGIPGTLGGMIYSNAGAFGKEISDFVASVVIYDIEERKIKEFSKDELCFSYRSSIFKNKPYLILSAKLRKTFVY